MPETAPRPPLRVLVVDDCRDTARTLAKLVELWGHQVRTALDGTAAVQSAREFQPDVVFLDLEMPGMSGWEAAREIQAGDGPAGALLVAISGHARDQDRRRSREAGFAHHLVKPVDPHVLQVLLTTGRSATDMLPEEMARMLTDMQAAADVVEAIDDPLIQNRRHWDLSKWRYAPVPWGVCFRRYDGNPEPDAEIFVVNAAGVHSEPVHSQIWQPSPQQTFIVLE